jgi:hypothetical protein
MPRSILPSLAALALVAACAQTSQSPAPTSATVNVPPAVAAPSGATAASADASTSAAATPDAGAAADEGDTATAMGAVDGGASAQFRACSVDADCVAVNRVGCCHNGWKEAVSAPQRDAYAASFTCPQAHPICPMFIVRDQRIAECDNTTHLCTMVRPEELPCEGFMKNAHHCPDGYICPVRRNPDIAGKCVRK